MAETKGACQSQEGGGAIPAQEAGGRREEGERGTGGIKQTIGEIK